MVTFNLFYEVFKKLESCFLVFVNWVKITEMATDRIVKNTKIVPKTAKELKNVFKVVQYATKR
jgi:hypothetical protein